MQRENPVQREVEMKNNVRILRVSALGEIQEVDIGLGVTVTFRQCFRFNCLGHSCSFTGTFWSRHPRPNYNTDRSYLHNRFFVRLPSINNCVPP